MATITIINDNSCITAKRGQFVLQGALRQGIHYPHSCRSGQCGHCKSKVHSGEIKHEMHDPHVLSEEEKQAGYFLPCRARVMSDLVIEWSTENDALLSTRAIVKQVEQLSENIARLVLQPQLPVPFHAGQYLHLEIDDLPPRPYSMANIPGAAELEFHIRKVEGGLVSNYIFNEMKVGKSLGLSGPLGLSCVQQSPDCPVILVATGTGLAPVLSIAQQLCQWNPTLPVRLYFGARDSKGFYYLDEIARIQAAYPCLNIELVQQTPSSTRRHGELDEIVANDINEAENIRFFLAGSPAMVTQVRDTLLKRGVATANIFSDEFTYQPPAKSVAQPPPAVSRKRRFPFSLFS